MGYQPEGGATRGSWFGNFQGQNNWRDKTDSGKQAGGQTVQDAAGIALPTRHTMHQLFDVTTPDGRTFTLPQTDLGPARWTGRGVDINANAAEQMGYTPANFPTDGHFSIKPHAGPRSEGYDPVRMAFSGEPSNVASDAPDPMVSALAGGQQQAGGAAAGGPAPMQVAAGRAAPPVTMPTGAAPGAGLVPMRPQVSREELIRGHTGGWVPRDAQQMQEDMYYMQHMPVQVPGMGGNWVISPQTGQAMWVPQPQMNEFHFPGGVTMPAPWHYGPGGEVVPSPVAGGGPSPSVTPTPQPTPDKSLDLTPDPTRPGALTQPRTAAPQFAEPDQAPAGLPPEITKGRSEPKGAATAPGKTLAFQPGQGAETPAPAQGGAWRMDPWHMTPQQMMGMGQEYQANVEAAKAHAGEDAKKYSDWMDSTQKAVSATYDLQNRVKLAQKFVNDSRLLQGPGADTIKMPWNKFLSFFGDEQATARVGISQAFDKLKSSNILTDMRQKLQGLGQVRLAEIFLLGQSNIGRENTPAANMAILNLAERTQWQMQKLGQIERLYDEGNRWDANGKMVGKTGEPPSFGGLMAIENQFMKNNPIATEQEMDQYERLFDVKGGGETPVTAKPTEAKPAMAQPAQPTYPQRIQKAIERKQQAQ
jgi:hypothetical protein